MKHKYLQVVGIDEAGRGCWAGPLVAAAVVLHTPLDGLKDSKLLSRKQRELLSDRIYENGIVGLGWVDALTIDEIGLTAATTRAMTEAISQIKSHYEEIIIDGRFNFLPAYKVTTLVKADSIVPAVSAASIVAKVARDHYMFEIARKFPNYQFERHVGYGTKLHHELLRIHGASIMHRKSFKPLQELLANSL